MKKRADLPMETVILMILLLVFIVIAANYDILFKKQVDKSQLIERCKLSVIQASALSVAGKPITSLDCPRIEYEIKLEDVLGKDGVDEEKIKRKFAEDLKTCWYKMGRGSAGGFDKNMIDIINTQDDYACAVCSQIRFDDDLIERMKSEGKSEKITNFKSFLSKEYVTSDTTYLEYFKRKVDNINYLQGPWTNIWDNKYFNEFDISKTYHVFYVVYKGSYLMDKLLDLFEEGNEPDLEEGVGMLIVADTDTIREMRCGVLVN